MSASATQGGHNEALANHNKYHGDILHCSSSCSV